MELTQQRYYGVMDGMEKLHALRRLQQRRVMETCGMYHGQLPILEFVHQNPGCTQVEIAQALFITPSSIAQSTKRLQRDGYLQKRMSADNQRSKRLFLTEKGREAAHSCRQGFDKIDREIFEQFSDEEIAVMENLVRRMLQSAAALAGVDADNLDLFTLFRLKHTGHTEECT